MSGDESERARAVICQAHGMTRVGHPGSDDGHIWDRLPDLLVQQIQAAVAYEIASARAHPAAEPDAVRESVTVDLSELNSLQLDSICRLAEKYKHGWHEADLVVRRDAVEKRYEADWVRPIARQIAAALRALEKGDGDAGADNA